MGQYWVIHSSGGTSSVGSDNYYRLVGSGNDQPDEGPRMRLYVDDSYTARRLYIRVHSNTGSNPNILYFRLNSGNGNQSISIPAGTTGHFWDGSNSDSIVDGDYINAFVDFAGTTMNAATMRLRYVTV